MVNILINWLLSAVSLMVVAQVVRGFDVTSFGTALIAALVIGLVNATVGLFLKIVTFPLTLVTLGIFWFVINALMLKLAAAFLPGFQIIGFLPAIEGAIVLAIAHMIIRWITEPSRAKANAQARPIPTAAAVTNARLPLRRSDIFFSISFFFRHFRGARSASFDVQLHI